MSFDIASKHFINRDFPLAVRELGPLPFQPKPKPWILYFALCDRAFVEPDRPVWPLNGNERKVLRASVLKGEFWEPMLLVWNSAANVPVAVVTAALGVTAKHSGDAAAATKFAESYLADTDDQQSARSVAVAFISDILVGQQHDYFYARELVNGELFAANEAERNRVIELIAEHEAQYVAHQKEEAELLAQQERERVAAAIAETQQEQESKAEPSKEPETVSSQAPAKAVMERQTRITRQPRSLPEIWRSWFREFIRSQGFYNFLALVFVICSLASSAGLRRQALRLRSWLWAALTQSAKMALTVTYL